MYRPFEKIKRREMCSLDSPLMRSSLYVLSAQWLQFCKRAPHISDHILGILR
jgi:hypothetical protein